MRIRGITMKQYREMKKLWAGSMGSLCQRFFCLHNSGNPGKYAKLLAKREILTVNDIKISAVIPAYNSAKFISRAIESVLAQSRGADEIIVVDDGSTDETVDIVGGFGGKVRLICQPNAGASAARNAGIQATAGNWIAFLDADDQWLPDRLRLGVELLQRNPDLAWIAGNYLDCLCDQQRRAEHTPQKRCLGLLAGADYFESYFYAWQKYIWGHADTMLIRKDALIKAGLFCTELPMANDIDMWLRVAYLYPKIGFVPQPLAVYHLGISGSIVRRHRKLPIYTDFIRRHIALAEEHNKPEQFRPCAAVAMKRWIRGLLFEARSREIREMIDTFPQFFSPAYRAFIKIATAFPRTTAAACHTFSRIIRILRLRGRVVREPNQS